MTLARLWVLHFLWILPFVLLALVVQHRKKQQSLAQFADPPLLKRLTAETHRGRRGVKGFLLLFALGLLVFSLAGPRWGTAYQEVRQKGVDILILVDVSASMRAEDIKPNRLEQAKREIIDFLRVIEGDRVGMVAFSGAAFVQCPLTLDYAALELFLGALEPGLIPVPGTDLGSAIETGLTAFDFKSETDKVMLMITDGEDNEKRGLKAARRAFAKGVRIFVFGIGDVSGAPIPLGDGRGGFKKDSEGKLILSRLNENGLTAIAADAGGRYVRATAGDMDLDMIYFDGIKTATRDQILKSGKVKIYEERFNLFVLAAFVLLLMEGMINEKKKKTDAALAAVLITFFFCSGITAVAPAFAGDDPDRLYREGRFAEAETAYARYDMDHPKDIRFRYNRGCSAYQNKDYKTAQAAFASVLKRTDKDGIRFKAAYNLGNTAYLANDFESAVKAYRQAVLLDPSSEDARHNLEMALRALEKQQRDEAEKSEQNAMQDSGQNDSKPSDSTNDPSSPSKNPADRDSETARDEPDPAAETKANDPAGGENSSQDRPPQGAQGDLSGELNNLQELPDKEKNEPASDQGHAAMSQRQAEALLDNIQEDPSKFLRFLFSNEKRQAGASGRDW